MILTSEYNNCTDSMTILEIIERSFDKFSPFVLFAGIFVEFLIDLFTKLYFTDFCRRNLYKTRVNWLYAGRCPQILQQRKLIKSIFTINHNN